MPERVDTDNDNLSLTAPGCSTDWSCSRPSPPSRRWCWGSSSRWTAPWGPRGHWSGPRCRTRRTRPASWSSRSWRPGRRMLTSFCPRWLPRDSSPRFHTSWTQLWMWIRLLSHLTWQCTWAHSPSCSGAGSTWPGAPWSAPHCTCWVQCFIF